MKCRIQLSRVLRSVAYLCGILVMVNPPGVAQTTTAAIVGTVKDATGAVLPGAEVAAANVGTGEKRTTTTNAEGRFLLAELPSGSYEITVSLAGFDTLVRKGITLAVGQQANLPLSMTVGAVSQQMTVTGEAPLVQTTEGVVSGLVDEKRITDLPLNGRDFTQLALVEPGVLSIRNSQVRSDKGFGTRVSMAGSRVDQTSWLLDGMNIKSFTASGSPGSASGLLLGVDAVREFQVLSTNYTTEFGGNSGGVINMVTKSGTNGLHGTAYEFLRNNDLDARNFFDVRRPAFKRNQFGGSLGGPIRKDRTFFFGNFEALKAPLGLTNVAFVPDANVHQGLVPGPGGSLQKVSIAPEIAGYLNIWPLPNGSPLVGGLGTLISPASQNTTEYYFMTRVDHRLTDNQSIFSRFTFDNGTQSLPDPIPIYSSLVETRTRYATFQLVSIWTPKLLSTTRVGYQRTLSGSDIALNINYPPDLFFYLNHRVPPQITLPGANTFGPTTAVVVHEVQNIYEVQESLLYATGNHSFKFGFDFQREDFNPDAGTADNPQYTWATIGDFLQDNPLSNLSVAVPGSTGKRTFRMAVFGFYFDDDWKETPNLTVNLGVRYERETVPTEKWGRLSVVENWVTESHFDVGVPAFKNPSLKNFAPRVGFAWDPLGDGKTAIRGGFGLFYHLFQPNDIENGLLSNPPFFEEVRGVPIPGTTLATLPAVLATYGPSLISSQFTPQTVAMDYQYNPAASYELKYNLAVERQLGKDVSVTLGYVGGRGLHLPRNSEINLIPPVTANGRTFVVPGTPTLNPNLGAGQEILLDAQSFYNALQLQIRKRFSRGFQLQASYTWSRNVDDSTTGVGATDFSGQGLSSQEFNTKADRGLSALQQEQNLVINGIWSLPSPAGPRAVSSILGGWQVSGIFSANSGTPFTITESGTNVPDGGRNAGKSKLRMPDWIGTGSFASVVNVGNPNHYFNASAFVVPPRNVCGNLGRDTFIGPGLLNFDMSLLKAMALKFREGSRLEFHADFFNIFNRANFAIPSGTAAVNGNNGAPIGSAGVITTTVTTSRQLQFGLKLIF